MAHGALALLCLSMHAVYIHMLESKKFDGALKFLEFIANAIFHS